MKKVFSVLAVLLLLVGSLSTTVFAESTKTDEKWGVTFTTNEKLESNFSLQEFNDAIYGMQPGDDVTITLKLNNVHPETVDWYMQNEVMESLEDASKTAGGGAYTYILTYKNVNGQEETLFSSDTVGGTANGNSYYVKDLEGLHGATDNLAEYFYLDTIAPGQEGVITLKVALDGETQGNDYQDTLAELRMRFAVELQGTEPETTPSEKPSQPPEEPTKPPTPPKNTTVVTTGELVHPLPLIIIAGASGLVLLVLAILGFKLRKSERKEAAK